MMKAEDIKSAVSMERILTHYGSTRQSSSKKFKCLQSGNHANGDTHPSATIWKDRLTCHSQHCFEKDDIFAVVGKVENLSTFSEQRAKIEEIFGLHGTQSGQKKNIVDTYDYVNEQGNLLFQTVRYQPKDFRQRRPDGKGGWTWNLQDTPLVLFKLPEVLAALHVLVVEGERDVLSAYALGLPEGWACTTAPMGAGKWKKEHSLFLENKSVVILPDHDKVGQTHGQQVAESLKGLAKDIQGLTLPDGFKDLSDWAEVVGTCEDLHELLNTAQPWNSPSADAAQHGGPQKGGASIHLQAVSSILPESVEFAWDGHIAARAVNLLVGEPDLGKSTIAFDLAAGWSTGTIPGAWFGLPVHVLIASCEDSPASTIRPRLEMAKADLSMVSVITVKRDDVSGGLSIPDDLPHLEAKMLEVGARALIIDPMMGHLGDVDSFKDQNIRKALGPLARLAESVNGAVLGIMHLNKRECSSIVARVGGSVGFVAAARSVLLAAQDPESEEHGRGVLIHAKCNVAPHAPTIRYQLEGVNYHHGEIEIQTSRVVWGQEAEHIHVGDVLRPEAQGTDEPGQKSEAKDWLTAFLQAGPKPSEDVVKRAAKEGPFSEKTLRRAKKELGVKAEKVGFTNSQWMWCLPEDGQKATEGGPLGEVGRLRENPCKKSKNSKDLPEDGQGSAGDHLRREDGHLRADPQPWLFEEPQKEAVMQRGDDGTFEEIQW